jgi:hypothetical protein
MDIPDDLNNRRIRQLIEQFNAEETYSELRSVLEELCKLIASGPISLTSSPLCVEPAGPCLRRPR